jgi:RNA-directed DNA polymerase
MQEPLNIEQQRKVRELFAAMESKQDIVDLLNYVQKVQWESGQTERITLAATIITKDIPTKEKKSKKAKPQAKYPKTDLRTLNFYANPDFFDKSRDFPVNIPGKPEMTFTMYSTPPRSLRYNEFKVAKKNGGERTIHAPSDKLKEILRTLNVIFQCLEQPSIHANGFVRNRSVVDNATKHVGSQYVYNIDLKDFFHSFDRNRVKLGFMSGEFGLNKEREPLAFFLASLCTHRFEEDGNVKYVLPQGAPTSPTITNLLCKPLDRRLNGLAKRFGAKYSRYADDITFSSQHNIFKKEEFQKELHRIIEEDQGLKINPKKTRLQKAGHSQSVTGLTVNEKVNVPSRYVKQLRMWLYYLERYGLEKAEPLFRNDYIKDKGHVKNQKTSMVNVIEGKLNYLKMVKGETDPTYKKLLKRFETLFPSKKKQQAGSVPATLPAPSAVDPLAGLPVDDYGLGKSSLIDDLLSGTFGLDESTFEINLGGGAPVQRADSNTDNTNGEEETTSSTSKPEGDRSALNDDYSDPFESLFGEEFMSEIEAGNLECTSVLDFDTNSLSRKSFEPEDIDDADYLVLRALERGRVSTISGGRLSGEETSRKLHEYRATLGLVDSDGHDPKRLVSLLKKFTENTTMKYSTHSWDFGNFRTYEDFMIKLKDEWSSVKKEMYKLNARLSAKIDTFFFRSGLVDPKNPSYKITWRNSDNHRLTIGWSSPELVEFCAKNPDVSPFTFPIPEHHKVTGLQLDYFRDVSNVFKRDIEFREEGNQLSTMLDLLWENVLGYNFVLERKGTDGLSFFTDVDWVKRSITRIFEQIRQRQSHPNVRVTVTKQKNAIELRIIHINSECMKDPNHPKLSGETGDFAELKKSLKSICDWSVESKFPDGKYYRLSYLVPQEQSTEKFIREIDHCEGFTHVLRFYL